MMNRSGDLVQAGVKIGIPVQEARGIQHRILEKVTFEAFAKAIDIPSEEIEKLSCVLAT